MFKIDTKVSDYMSIVLTHDCTRNCPFCIDKHRGCGVMITDADFAKALRFAKRKHIKDILLTGGEPTLHPNVLAYAQMVKAAGFRLIFTTNCDRPDLLYLLDEYVDCFNFSHYGQQMPDPKRFKHADLTISKLLYKRGIDSKAKLDAFIDKYSKDFYLKFSSMTEINGWTADNNTSFVDQLEGEKVLLFGEVPGLVYRGHIIKRYDCTSDSKVRAKQSYKALANGKIARTWEM